MIPITFPEANHKFGPPKGYDESQVRTIPAFVGEVNGGSVDGSFQVIVAWKPTKEEVKQLIDGAPIFVTMMGGLAPHALGTSFKSLRQLS